MMKWMVSMFVLLQLAGCAGSSHLFDAQVGGNGKTCEPPSQEQMLALNLARDMVNEGRLYAALAHLQGLSSSLPEVRLGQAQVMRRLGRSEAQGLYQSLLGTCLAAAGRHGLGQLAVARGDLEEAEQQLREAVRLAPVDARVRNDMGVLYLRQGRVEEANFEFLTAMELDQADTRPALNLLALLFYQQRWDQAAKLITSLGLSAEQTRSAEALAKELKQPTGRTLPLADASPVMEAVRHSVPSARR